MSGESAQVGKGVTETPNFESARLLTRLDVLACAWKRATPRSDAATISSPMPEDGRARSANNNDIAAVIMTDRRIVRVTGHLVHSDILGKVLTFVAHSIQGRHVRTLPLSRPSVVSTSVAVNSSETLMVLTCMGAAQLLLVNLLTQGVTALRIGGALKHLSFSHVYFHTDDTALVSSVGGERLYEINVTDIDSSFTVDVLKSIHLAGRGPMCCSSNTTGTVLCVGTWNSRVLLLDYPRGTITADVAVVSDPEVNVSDVYFVLDDMCLVVSVFTLDHLLLYDVATMAKLCTIGVGGPHTHKHVCCSRRSDEIIALMGGDRVEVFNVNDGVVMKTFGTRGSDDGQFTRPLALCTANGRVYVLDQLYVQRVQVFE